MQLLVGIKTLPQRLAMLIVAVDLLGIVVPVMAGRKQTRERGPADHEEQMPSSSLGLYNGMVAFPAVLLTCKKP